MQQRSDPVCDGRQQLADIVILLLVRTERHATTAVGRRTPSSTSA